MNQILVTDVENNSQTRDMKPVIRFFCIVGIIFSLVLIGEGGFNLYKKFNSSNDVSNASIVKMQKNGSNLNLLINGENGINKVIYSWNDGEQKAVSINGRKDANVEIPIPKGENKLLTSILYTDGKTTKYEGQTVSATARDTIKPALSIENTNGKLTVTAKDETELDYFSYQWEGSDEVLVYPTEENKTMIEQELEVKQGSTKLTLTAVDKAGNKETSSKKIIGSNGPTIKASISEGNFVVKVSDEFGITKIEYTHNQEEHTVEGIPQNAKEYEFKVPLKEGDNYLKINAYENGIMTEYKCKKTK